MRRFYVILKRPIVLTGVKDILKNIIYMARRFKLATTFNMVGLVVAFATFYLLMTQIIYEVNFNHGLKDYDLLYRMEDDFVYNEWEFSDAVCRPFAEALDSMPQVDCYSLVTDVSTGNNLSYYTMLFLKDGVEIPYIVTYGNNTVVSTLTDKVLDGSIEWTDDDSKGLIIPASIAMEYFGSVHVKGRIMTYRDPSDPAVRRSRVRGVFADFPSNSEQSNHVYKHMGDMNMNSLNCAFKCVVKFKTVPDDLDAFAEDIKRQCIENLIASSSATLASDELSQSIRAIRTTRFKFTPLKDSYFEYSSFTSSDSGYKVMLTILELACLLVIIIAVINFLNFTLTESPVRVRSLNTRIVFGASRRRLRLSLIAECVITALVACVIALALCALLSRQPFIAQLTDGVIDLRSNIMLALSMLGIAVLAGVAAGLYPAMFATSFPPALLLKTTLGLTPQGRRLRTVLICMQLAISLLLVMYIGILYMQNRYIFTSNYGYNKDRILVSLLPVYSDVETLQQELKRLPGVENVALSNVLLGSTDGHDALRTEANDSLIRYCQMGVDNGFMSTMGIKIIEGRDFEESDTMAIIVNESTIKKWGWPKLGTRVSIGFDEEKNDSATVVGVCEDIRYGTIRIGNDQPFFFILDKSEQATPGCGLNVLLAEGAPKKQVMQQANKLIKQYCGEDANGLIPFDDMLGDAYHSELRYFQLIYYLTIICLISTLIGVSCMTIFETEHRRKEIGIRKVAGATTGEIVMMFCRHYMWLILIGFVIAAPIALWCGRETLKNFADKTPVSQWWWVFPVGLLLVGGVTLGTVALQCWYIARENPITSIKNE